MNEQLARFETHTVDNQPPPLLDYNAYDTDLPPLEAAAKYWEETVEATLRYGPLFFELAAHAMQGKEHAASLRAGSLRRWLVAPRS